MRKSVLALCFAVACPVFANDGAILRVVLDKIKYEQWENAEDFSKHAKDPIVSDIFDWYALRAGRGTYSQYHEFLSEKSDWPGLPWMQGRAEPLMPETSTAAEVVAFYQLIEPQTPKGLARLIKVYVEIGNIEKAYEVYLGGAARLDIPVFVMNEIKNILPDFTNENLDAHINQLMLREKIDLVKEYLPTLAEEQQSIVEARIDIHETGDVVVDESVEEPATLDSVDLNSEDENVIVSETAVETVTANPIPDTAEIAFEKFRFAFKNKNRRGARAILLERSTSREALGNPEYWVQDDRRVRLSGDAIWEGNYEEAYQIASTHFLEKNEVGYSEAEWKSGFIALEFFKDQKRARKHFQNFKDTVDTPISNGRAGYWLGRAGDPDGYEYGAKFQTSFFGQLAAEAGSIPYDDQIISAPKPELSFELLAKDSVHAGLLFKSANEVLLADRFFRHESETLPPMDAEALGILATTLGLPHASVGIGKNLSARNEIVMNSYYPMPEIFNQPIPVRHALAYSITRQESEFYQRAGSSVGARGYMQLMPATGDLMAKREGIPFVESDLMNNGGYNIRLGTAYLDQMSDKFDGKLALMAAGYNAGPGRSEEWLLHNGPLGPTVEDAVRWVELIPFEETHNYVQRVLEGVFVYDAKVSGRFEYNPSDLLLKPYPSPQ